MEGVLFIPPDRNALLRTAWKSRYVVLTHDSLLLFKRRNDEPTAAYPLAYLSGCSVEAQKGKGGVQATLICHFHSSASNESPAGSPQLGPLSTATGRQRRPSGYHALRLPFAPPTPTLTFRAPPDSPIPAPALLSQWEQALRRHIPRSPNPSTTTSSSASASSLGSPFANGFQFTAGQAPSAQAQQATRRPIPVPPLSFTATRRPLPPEQVPARHQAPVPAAAATSSSSPPPESILDRAFNMRYIPGQNEDLGDRVSTTTGGGSSIARFEALMAEMDARDAGAGPIVPTNTTSAAAASSNGANTVGYRPRRSRPSSLALDSRRSSLIMAPDTLERLDRLERRRSSAQSSQKTITAVSRNLDSTTPDNGSSGALSRTASAEAWRKRRSAETVGAWRLSSLGVSERPPHDDGSDSSEDEPGSPVPRSDAESLASDSDVEGSEPESDGEEVQEEEHQQHEQQEELLRSNRRAGGHGLGITTPGLPDNSSGRSGAVLTPPSAHTHTHSHPPGPSPALGSSPSAPSDTTSTSRKSSMSVSTATTATSMAVSHRSGSTAGTARSGSTAGSKKKKSRSGRDGIDGVAGAGRMMNGMMMI